MSGQCYTNTSLANRYHGLMKQGSTCYLNSVLQVLFMTEDFREAVTRYSEEKTEFLDHHLKALFDALQNHKADTYQVIQKLGIDNVYEQRDAAEYFERILRMTNPDSSQIFHGHLANKTTCSKGHIQTDRDAPFWHLPLSLVDSCSKDYSVVKGIEEFFKTSDFCGENQMYCEQCDDKVDATMTDVIKHHPDVLCLLLKRFEFNYNYMSYVKIRCTVNIPYTLHIPESQTYELYAFVDHFGDLRGGHYTATIKITEEHGDRWYKFDDTSVTELVYQPFQVDNTERSQTAYLLFYRKKKGDTGIQDFTDVSTSGIIPLTTNNENDQTQVGKNKRKREEDADDTETEDIGEAACSEEVEGSTEPPCNVAASPISSETEDMGEAACSEEAEGSTEPPCDVDPLDNEANDDNGTTGSDDLEQKHIGVDDVKKKRPDNNTDFKPEVSDTKKSHPADTVGDNICEHQENKENTETYYTPSPIHAEQEEEKIKTDSQHDAKAEISADKPTAEVGCDTFQDKEKVDDRKENILRDDQSHKHGNKHNDHSDTLNTISVTHSSESDVCTEREICNMKEDRREKKGDNKGDHSKFGQNTAGEVIGDAKTQKDVDVEEEMKVKEYKGNTEQIQIREKSHLRPAGAEIIEGPKENQDSSTNEKTFAESCESKARAEIQEVTEGGCGSQKPGKVQITYTKSHELDDVEIEAAGSEYDETSETCGCSPFRNKKQRQHRKKNEKQKQKKTTGTWIFAWWSKKWKRPGQVIGG